MSIGQTPRSVEGSRVVVIGSGPAGATAAWELVQQGIPVTVLESGREMPRGLRVRTFGQDLMTRLPGRERPARHVASGDPSTVWHCELAPGGLSNWWAGATPRFAPEDFTEGERLSERYRWPLDYADLEPFYDRVEQLMPISGTSRDVAVVPACHVAEERSLPPDWQTISRAANTYGHDVIPLPVAATGASELTTRATWFNSYAQVLQRIPATADLSIVLGAHAVRIEHDGANPPRANAVIYRNRATGKDERIDAAAVVVAAGTLASTQLLLASTSPQFPEGLGNTHGVLGRYLHDHPSRVTYFTMERALRRIAVAAYMTRAPYADAEPLRAASGTMRSVTFLRSVAERRPGLSATRDIACTWFGTIIPDETQTALLHSAKRDEFGVPWLDIRLKHSAQDLATMDAARDRFLQIMQDAKRPTKVTRETVRPPGDSVHYGGTIRMHHSPEYGVLDAFSRMHAVPNVIVADAASFTTGAEKNPTLTLMALASRASARLAADLRARD